jgi:Flp pilus assembly pilin Flp
MLPAVGYTLARLMDVVASDATGLSSDGERRTPAQHSYSELGEPNPMSKAQMLLLKTARGATMVEYALLIIAIMFLAAIGYRNLGKSVKQNAVDSQGEIDKR